MSSGESTLLAMFDASISLQSQLFAYFKMVKQIIINVLLKSILQAHSLTMHNKTKHKVHTILSRKKKVLQKIKKKH